MSLLAFTSSIELGLIYALVSLGIFISYRILNIADLTVDGSFTLGAAVAAVMAITVVVLMVLIYIVFSEFLAVPLPAGLLLDELL